MAGMSLFSNLMANNTQYYLSNASNAVRKNATKLSSGNAIEKASDDVAGLAVGTVLQTNVNALKAALTNVSQAQTMLNVADGGLRGEINILTRMKSLATQATAGGLSKQSYTYLNQEFNNLVSQIDQIASTTSFNGKNIIDGSLYAPSKITTATGTPATAAKGTMKIATAFSGNNVQYAFINGAQIPFINGANYSGLSSNDQKLFVDTSVYTTATTQAGALYNVIQSTMDYSGTDSYILSVKQKLNQLSYSYNSQTITMTSTSAGTVSNGSSSCTLFGIGASTATASDVLVNGGNGSAVTYNTAVGLGYYDATHSPLVVAVDGDLSAGTFASTMQYDGTATVIPLGLPCNDLLYPLEPTIQSLTGFDASLVSNNPSFIGTVQGFKANYVSPNIVNLSVKVGDYTYEASNINTNFNMGELITFESIQSGGGSFNLQFTQKTYTITNQSDANQLGADIDGAIVGIDFYQKRRVTTYVPGGIITDSSNNKIGDLSNSKFYLFKSDFSNVEIMNIDITAPSSTVATPTITLTMKNGEIYQSGYDGYGNAISLSSTITDGSTLGFVSTTNPNNMFTLNYANGKGTSLDISSQSKADTVAAALEKAFNMNSGASKITYQIGLSSSDSINVAIQGATSRDIFLDNNGSFSLPSISTITNATTATQLIDNAISAISSNLSYVGSLQLRFGFISSSLNTAIINQDAARGMFLDTEIPSTASQFAQAQVMLNSSIAVLAQANMLNMALLDLLKG